MPFVDCAVLRDSQIVIRDSRDELRSRRSWQRELLLSCSLRNCTVLWASLAVGVRSRACPCSRTLWAKQRQRFGCQSSTRPGRLRLEGRWKVAPKAVLVSGRSLYRLQVHCEFIVSTFGDVAACGLAGSAWPLAICRDVGNATHGTRGVQGTPSQ